MLLSVLTVRALKIYQKTESVQQIQNASIFKSLF